ncbi:unnamed protein product [Medioppia subpectinata]|uniref:Carboxylic ester hydrolase n=1 Tax=Medioppia subpectinata TaxID=1979941 RepID=A0A7R9L7Q1_9ACAR|nr:unnamed protein product [Medioppia subpectinata]CAG2116027.1 unnamed protein product [Medioppia subpectinata]
MDGVSVCTVSVRVTNGLITGKVDTFNGTKLNVFLGIPYAKPPVGALRLKKPVPVNRSWTQPLDATQWPKACVHQKIHQNYFNVDMNEDCLYLNIWSPALPNSTETTALKPVMFWIHGGGLMWGSAVEKWYSGHVIAAMGDVVVVTFNYRLSTFGLLYTGAKHSSGAPGNMALWDQALALEWVVDNIANFGGDPTRITVFGESAGAISTSLHVVSPITRHLFQRAIVMSGAFTNAVCNANASERLWYERAVAIGCDVGDKTGKTSYEFTPEMIKCMRGLSADDLLKAKDLTYSPCELDFMIDGHFLPHNPIEMLKSGDHKKDMDLLIGTVVNEGSFLFPIMIDPVQFNKRHPKHMTYAEAREYAIRLADSLQSYLTHVSHRPPVGDIRIDGQQVADIYLNGLSNATKSEVFMQRMGQMYGDFRLGCPNKLFARYIHSGQPNSRVYEYYYSAKFAAGDQLFCADWMGVCHFDDIYIVFGLPFQEYDRYGRPERHISAQMIETFTRFAWTGRPARLSGADWPQYYTIAGNTVIAPYYEFSVEPKVDTNFGLNVKSVECEHLWYQYLN